MEATRYSWLVPFLQSKVPSGSYESLCVSVIPSIVDSIAGISKALRSYHQVAQAGSANAFGDDQLNVDVAAETILRKRLALCPSIVTASSEEEPVERPTREDGSGASESEEQYTIAFDPLDGSSIIAPNWTVGTIIGVWEGRSALRQAPAERQVASVLGVYGPRTTAIVALRVPGAEGVCFEIGIGDDGAQGCEVVRTSVQLQQPPFKTRYFAPANLRAAAEDQNYGQLVNHYIQNKYTLRYSGGLVPDVVHALVKGHGIYISPVTSVSKAKLRRLYELFPIALVIECAGGKAVDPVDGSDILKRPAEDTDERGGLICGTAEDVEFAVQSLVKSS
ncbi:fructose-1-6-bisphosphatase [Truncatella angustata]|uniref:Fructose-1-6-bisphosphatase n=1 Tax=Truncatella angustata TaxID=152316 RepID=A0A9P8US53_9PEZI|nr:fructose-1-6-bisphosphatase [Truncatella angustata]KAH6658030.1 fructose-1-6-bisphosphatase [Truncatella angustata]